jgi:hypothetical protein
MKLRYSRAADSGFNNRSGSFAALCPPHSSPSESSWDETPDMTILNTYLRFKPRLMPIPYEKLSSSSEECDMASKIEKLGTNSKDKEFQGELS